MKKNKEVRRASALVRLKTQLESGVKTAKKTGVKVSLTDADRGRIGKEISKLSK